MQHDTHQAEPTKKMSGIPILVIAIILALLAIFLKNSYNMKSDFWASKNGTTQTDTKAANEEVDAAPTK